MSKRCVFFSSSQFQIHKKWRKHWLGTLAFYVCAVAGWQVYAYIDSQTANSFNSTSVLGSMLSVFHRSFRLTYSMCTWTTQFLLIEFIYWLHFAFTWINDDEVNDFLKKKRSKNTKRIHTHHALAHTQTQTDELSCADARMCMRALPHTVSTRAELSWVE